MNEHRNPPLEALRHHVSGAVARGEREPITELPAHYCPCGQLLMGSHHDRCPACREAERAPQGTQPSLFTHVPQLAGQIGMEL